MSSESKDFGTRLQKALKDAGYSAYGPTQLAHQFNIRFSGHAISVHAARKWLMGEAIPTQDKIRVLAEWLVVPADWLRFGGPNAYESPTAPVDAINPVYAKLITDIQKLDPHHRKFVFEFVRLAAKLNSEAKDQLPETPETDK